jgi:hypothetical protein
MVGGELEYSCGRDIIIYNRSHQFIIARPFVNKFFDEPAGIPQNTPPVVQMTSIQGWQCNCHPNILPFQHEASAQIGRSTG